MKRLPFSRYDRDKIQDRGRCNENRLISLETNYVRKWYVLCSFAFSWRSWNETGEDTAWRKPQKRKRERPSSQSLYANFATSHLTPSRTPRQIFATLLLYGPLNTQWTRNRSTRYCAAWRILSFNKVWERIKGKHVPMWWLRADLVTNKCNLTKQNTLNYIIIYLRRIWIL